MNASLIFDLLTDKSCIKRAKGICESVNNKIADSTIVSEIKKLEEDNSVFWNDYLVSDFATAALHLMRIKEYTGKRETVTMLIDSNLIFS